MCVGFSFERTFNIETENFCPFVSFEFQIDYEYLPNSLNIESSDGEDSFVKTKPYKFEESEEGKEEEVVSSAENKFAEERSANLELNEDFDHEDMMCEFVSISTQNTQNR